MPRVDDRKKEYDVLGLDTSANEVDIKKAFTHLALKYHPDSNLNGKGIDQEKKLRYQEICKAYKRIMAGLSQSFDNCSTSDWNNDKSDEIFFSLLGELIQNSTRTSELFTLLSAQANSKSQFQNDNEYRCKEDAMEDDDEEAELNKLVDILKNRLQNGKSVPAGLTQEKLTRLKDDFLKQKEENRRTEKNHQTPTKKAKTAATVPVAKPKPKSKKQLQAEQRRREMEMATIAKELEAKKKMEEEKEQERKKQEKERKRQIEEEKRKEEEQQRRIQNENKKKKEREEKEREQRALKERERLEKLKKSQEEEQRKKEEEKRRKAEEKAAKQKSSKEAKEREEKEKQNQKNQKQRAATQYAQQQQQQTKYPREVPPRFLRQQQMKQSRTKDQSSDSSTNYDNSNYGRDSSNHNGWTEITPDTNITNRTSASYHGMHIPSTEDWDLDNDSQNDISLHNPLGGLIGNTLKTDSSWGGIPASEDWDLDINSASESEPIRTGVIEPIPGTAPIGSEARMKTVSKNLFSNENITDVPPPKPIENNESSWGASLTGSTWDTVNTSLKQWDASSNVSKSSTNDERAAKPAAVGSVNSKQQQQRDSSITRKNISTADSTHSSTSGSKNTGLLQQVPHPVSQSNRLIENSSAEQVRTGSPGITSWAGLDSFDAGPTLPENTSQSKGTAGGGTKPRQNSTTSSTNKSMTNSYLLKEHHLTNGNTPKTLSGINNRVDTNMKVSGWLESSSPSGETWKEESSKNMDEDFGWTMVAKPSKKVVGSSGTTSAPDTPSKQDGSNAWTNRALKQLLDMGFQRGEAEKALRNNNGIIESAVSDLLMRAAEKAESPPSQPSSSKTKNSNVTANGSNTPSSGNQKTDTNGNAPPQKLNRKQRRKLQQMQNAENQLKNAASQQPTSVSVPTTTADPPPLMSANSTTSRPTVDNVGLKLNGDGLLPTPPASLRIMSNDPVKPDSLPENIIGRKLDSQVNSDLVGVIQKPIRKPTPIGQEAKQNETMNIQSNAKRPIGSSRPSTQQPIQAPAPIQPPNPQSSAAQQPTPGQDIAGKMSNTDLQPPTNPVLLAQMHLQKLGLEEPRSSAFPTPSTSSQTVTNSYIQQYLQQMNKASSESNTASSGASSITTPLLATSSMSLSSLLPQPPVLANSLSDGPQKSKLLQWTQPNSASNSEPTTPPSADEGKDKSGPQKIDPVSAKWGVVAAPRLSPTPAEFKPGVPWRPRGISCSEEKEEQGAGDLAEPPHAEETAIPQTSFAAKLSQQQQEQEQLEFKESMPPVHGPPGLQHEAPPPHPMENKNSNEFSWVILKGLPPMVDVGAVRAVCQQYGTLLQFKSTYGITCINYETANIAKIAAAAMNGKTLANSQISAEVSTEQHCALVMNSSVMNGVPPTQPQPPIGVFTTLSQSQPPPPVSDFPNTSSFGGLWGSPGQPPTLSQGPPPQPFMQQNFPPVTFSGQGGPAPPTMGMNGAFSHWGIPANPPPVLPHSNQLWGPAPPQPQPANVFPAYTTTAWLQAKPVEQVPNSVFTPNMDHCLPSELLSFTREQGS